MEKRMIDANVLIERYGEPCHSFLDIIESTPTISDEEFKVEAKRRGYNLIKIPEHIKLLPCVCGNAKHHRVFIMRGLQYYSCQKCGLVAEEGKTERQAKLNWNKRIEEKTNEL